MTTPHITAGATVTHKHDPAFVATVLSVTPEGVRVHKGDKYNYMECTMDAKELQVVAPVQAESEGNP